VIASDVKDNRWPLFLLHSPPRNRLELQRDAFLPARLKPLREPMTDIPNHSWTLGLSAARSSAASQFVERLSVRRATTRFAMLAGLGVLLAPLPGCQSITGSPALSQVRVIDASPDAPGLDVYQSNGILAYNLGLGTITSYVPISPGNYNIAADTAGTRQQLVSATGTFLTNAQYTVLISNYSNTLQELILKDQTQSAPSGQIAVRFIAQSTRVGLVDLYLIPTGSTVLQVRPVLTSLAFNTNTGYFNVPTGTYTLVALIAGTVPTTTGTTLYTGSAITYSSGSAKTFILIDQQLLTTPGLQVILANDFNPTGATS